MLIGNIAKDFRTVQSFKIKIKQGSTHSQMSESVEQLKINTCDKPEEGEEGEEGLERVEQGEQRDPCIVMKYQAPPQLIQIYTKSHTILGLVACSINTPTYSTQCNKGQHIAKTTKLHNIIYYIL